MAYELTTLEKFSIYSDVIGTFLIAFAVYTDYWVEVTFSRILPMKESPLHGHYGLMLVCYRTCNFINPIEGGWNRNVSFALCHESCHEISHSPAKKMLRFLARCGPHVAVILLCNVAIVINLIGSNLTRRFHAKTFYVIGLMYILGGLLTTAALVTFSNTCDEVAQRHFVGLLVLPVTLGYSFTLCCIGNGFTLVAAVGAVLILAATPLAHLGRGHCVRQSVLFAHLRKLDYGRSAMKQA